MLIQSFSSPREKRRRKKKNEGGVEMTRLSENSESKSSSRRRRRMISSSIPAVLVASFLVINVDAAPAPSLQQSQISPSIIRKPLTNSASPSYLSDLSTEHNAYANEQTFYNALDGDTKNIAGLRWVDLKDEYGDRSQASAPVTYHKRNTASQRIPWYDHKRDGNRHQSLPYTKSSTNETTTFNVPASFTSTLADAWEPVKRSVWFQRKAVIITSIFLAIFIVLIIGATVFLRDKRHDDLEEEYDVSDEAALERMREEREMRLGSRGEKKKNKKKRGKWRTKGEDENQNGDDDGDNDAGGEKVVTTTAIAASRWARLPIRKIRLRKKRSSKEKGSNVKDIQDSSSVGGTPVSRRNQTSLRSAVESSSNAHDSMDADGSTEEQRGSPSTMITQTSSITQGTDGVPPLPSSTTSDNELMRISTSASGSSPDVHPSSTRAPLTAEDLNYADQEEERMLLSDALPPAYIPNQERSQASSSSTSNRELHPTANRQLAGQDRDNLFEARGDEKVGLHSGLHDDSNDDRSQEDGSYSATNEFLRQDTGLQAHIATDDKSVLSRMNQAASQPSTSAPHYAPEASSAGQGSNSINVIASAPVIEEDDDIDIAHAAIAESSSPYSKGKDVHTGARSSLLPAPPNPHIQSSFSSFDLPYTLQPRKSNVMSKQESVTTSRTSEKAKEAAEEERHAAALLASRPEDERSLPQYEREERVSNMMSGSTMQPSAPVWEEEDEEDGSMPVMERTTNVLTPSAPPIATIETSEDEEGVNI